MHPNTRLEAFCDANGFLLLTVVFMPFPTALVGEYVLTDHAAPAVVTLQPRDGRAGEFSLAIAVVTTMLWADSRAGPFRLRIVSKRRRRWASEDTLQDCTMAVRTT